MNQSMIAVFDKKTSFYHPPMAFRSIADAIREFETLKKDDKTRYGQHPEDYELYKLGEFNDDNGEFIPMKPIHLG